MYSLLMVYRRGEWDRGGATFDLGRYLEFTNDSLVHKLKPITEDVIEQLKSWPALFAYELATCEDARVGWLKDIQVRNNSVRISFDFDPLIPPISTDTLESMLWELDIEYETQRTHWAVKDIDLYAVLRKKGVTADLPAQVPAPELGITSETVERALEDAEQLLATGRGASSAIDRVHTALHGYLIVLCKEANLMIDSPDRLSMTALFKKLREEHPKFAYAGPRETEIGSVLKASSAIIEGINTLRNNASVAHPNEAIVPEPEAMYLVNLTRSLLHYIEMKRKE